LTRFARALTLSRELVHFPYGRFPIAYTKNLYTMAFTHCYFARPVANILRFDALMRANDGDMSGALVEIRAILHASRAHGDDPILASMYSRISVDQVAVAMLERVLGLGEGSDKDLREIQYSLLEQAQTPYYLIGARGERAGCDRLLEAIQERELPVNEFAPLFLFTKSTVVEKALLLYTSISIGEQRAQMMNLLTDAIEIGKLPPEKQKDAFDDWQADFRKNNMHVWSLSRWMVPALPKAAEWDIRAKAVLTTAAVGVAAERYRLAHGRWPARLDDLVPQFLPALPRDPYDGKPLKWKQGNGTFLVYSVGFDRIDNGGDLDSKQPNQTGSDIGFLLFDPTRRRQPARPFAFKTEDP
jgi:hypothetical protein